jgi:hypothetical protein
MKRQEDSSTDRPDKILRACFSSSIVKVAFLQMKPLNIWLYPMILEKAKTHDSPQYLSESCFLNDSAACSQAAFKNVCSYSIN